MYRLIEGMKNRTGKLEPQVRGALTDYDLSSWVASLKSGYTKSSQQQTGTPPYMAQELLKGTSNTHLDRHDVESLFCVMLLMCARHTTHPTEDTQRSVFMRSSTQLPYQRWFDQQDYATLGSLKETFFSDMQAIELSPTFEDFRLWLEEPQSHFHLGFKAKPLAPEKGQRLARLLTGGPAG